jgi:hypothetical protein
LGKGGMGAVYLAHDTQLDRPVALKVPTFAADDDSQVLERFYREARAAATVFHPNVCPVHDVGEIDGVPYLTMGYIEGKPLGEFVAGCKGLTPRQAAALVRKVALALAEAHKRGVIHRDLKPANIMIDRRGEPVLMDFGLARRARPGDVRLTQQGATMGTPAYMPPEQASGDLSAVGPASDVYSLGVILYELLARRLPFTGDLMAMLSRVLLDDPPPPSQFCPGLDPELEGICLKAMAKKPRDRYPSMTAFAAALQDYLRGGKDTAEQPRATAPGPTASPAPGYHASVMGGLRSVAQLRPPPPAAKPGEEAVRRRRPKARRRRGVPLWAWIAGAGSAALLLVFGLILYQATHHGADPGEARAAPPVASLDPGDDQRDNLREKAVALPGPGDDRRENPREKEAAVSSPNALTEQERAGGWKLLFDGKTTQGWRGYRRRDVPERWRVEDGALALAGGPGGAHCDLVTVDEYDNFELVFEWKIAPGGNSGVMYRVTEDQPQPWATGPEYQLIDDTRNPDGRTPEKRTASCYGLYPPGKDVTRPAGEWNQSRIVVNGGHVAHWLNGEKVVTYELGSRDWEQHVAATRFRQQAKYGKAPRGHIDLQDNGDPVAFRDLKIRPLAPPGVGRLVGQGPNAGEIRVFRGHEGTVWGVAESKDGRRVLSGSEDQTVRLWDVQTGLQVGQPWKSPEAVHALALSPEGPFALVGTPERRPFHLLLLSDIGKVVMGYGGHTDRVSRVLFSADGKKALSGGWDHVVILWDVASGKEERSFTGHQSVIGGLAFLPGGKHILTGSHDGTLREWEIATGKEVGKRMEHPTGIDDLALSPDGKTVLTACFDNIVRLWDVSTHAEVREYKGHTGGVTGVAFTPDGKRFVSCGADRTVRL